MRKEQPWIGLAVTAFLAIGFGIAAADSLRWSLPEYDLLWMVPAMSSYTAGKSVAGVLSFLLGALPIGFAQPVLKLYLFIVDALMGPQTRWLLLASFIVHALSSGLLYLLGRRLGLGRAPSWAAALLFFSCAVHFHAVVWPPAAQHLFAVLTILLLLVLYLETEERLSRGIPSAGMYAASLAVALFSSLQRSAFIAPVLIGVHLLVCSKDPEERFRRYVRWMIPLGCAYLSYQAWVITQVGDPVVTEVLRKMPWPKIFRPYLVVDPLDRPNPVAPWARTFTVWVVGALSLGFGAALLRGMKRPLSRKGRTGLITLACVLVYVSWARHDARQVLLPYNMLAPFLATMAGLLEPFRAGLSSNSAEGFYYFPAQVSPWSVLAVLGAALFFRRKLLPRNRALVLLPAWYLLTTVLTLHQVSSFPLRTPSRYFLYVTPPICLLLAVMLSSFFEHLKIGRSERPGWRSFFFWCVVALLGLSNLAAIRVALFRGRLANTYLAYDDLRVVRLVEEDLPTVQRGKPVGTVWVSGVLPMPLQEKSKHIPLEIPDDYDNLSFIAEGMTGHGAWIRGLHLGEQPPQAVIPRYRVERDRLLRRDGENADLFVRRMEQGLEALKKDPDEAKRLLIEAVRTRPFLLRYLLGSLRLMDTLWLTDGTDLQDWLNRTNGGHASKGDAWVEKTEQVRSVVSREVSDFVLCLFLVSYVEHTEGDKAESQYWLSQIQLLDRDPERVAARLGSYPVVRADPSLGQFLEKVRDPLFFIEPFDRKKEDYAFGRFLARLLFGWNIRSSWDRRFYPSLDTGL